MKPISSFRPLKAAERVEHAVAPQKLIGGGRQLVAIGTEFQLLLRTMLAQIMRDDAVLQHPSEGDAVTAGRPRQLSRQREIRRQQHRRTGDDGEAALDQSGDCDPSAQKRTQRSIRRRRVRATPPSVALCVAAAKAVKANSRHFSIVDVCCHARPG